MDNNQQKDNRPGGGRMPNGNKVPFMAILAIALVVILGITMFFWGCALIAVWKWLFGLAKRFFHWLCPNFRKNKSDKQ